MAHVRVCGGAGWVTTGSTRKLTAHSAGSVRMCGSVPVGRSSAGALGVRNSEQDESQRMTDIIYRPFTAQDAPAVYQVALEAWQYTYQGLYDAAFITAFVQTHYAPGRLAALGPQVQSGTMFFEVAVHDAQIVGYC